MTALVANGYECLDCGDVERDGIGRADVMCGSCERTNTIQRLITDCDLGQACNDDRHDYGAGWHVEEAIEP